MQYFKKTRYTYYIFVCVQKLLYTMSSAERLDLTANLFKSWIYTSFETIIAAALLSRITVSIIFTFVVS